MTRDFLIGTGLISVGIATMVVIVSPMGISPLLSSGGETTKRVKGEITDRWLPPAAPKADQLKVTLAEPSLLDPTLIGPADGNPIEQATERKIFDQQVETNAKEYHRSGTEPREYCARHGMHRVYFHRHRHLIWRCHH